MDSRDRDPRVGRILQGRYRILARIDEGAIGTVYRGERLKLGRTVAIKFLHPRFAADPTFMKRFEREALAMSRLSHPHCVSVLDFGCDDVPYIVMDYATGRTLRELLERGPLPAARALAIVRQVLAGLAHAHGQGIVHRDIKPANVMLSEATGTGDHARILDFGLATLRDSGLSGDVSQGWLVVGTPAYMSPEQSLGETVDARTDVYALGVVLFELVTGRKPFDGDDAFETLRMHREAPVPRLTEVAPGAAFPDGLQAAIDRAMAKRPEDRYASAAEFAAAVDAVVAAIPEPNAFARTVRAARPPDGAAVERGRRRRAAAVAGWMLLATVVAGAAAWYRVRIDAGRAGPVAGAEAGDGEWGRADRGAERAIAAAGDAVDAARADRGAERAIAAAGGAVDDAGAGGDGVAVAQGAADAGTEGDGTAVAGAAGAAAGGEAVADATGADGHGDASAAARLPSPALAAATAAPAGAAATDRAPPVPAGAEPAADAGADDEGPPPVPAPPDDASEDDESPDREPPDPAPPVDVRTVADAKRLLAAGRRDEAIAGLRALHRRHPRSAYIPYLLGNAYFDKRWWTVGMQHYRRAIAADRSYRRRATLIRNAIRALGSEKTKSRAIRLLLRDVGRAALPHLRRAARADKNPNVRRRAAWLIDRLTAKRPAKRTGRATRSKRRRR
ncbi:MAG: serine/threonine protein kinase [Deltaproteobacteria bacterium]|nr:MAG: serine/threonine protein kinase [Deltaproteobacteria bacterium]